MEEINQINNTNLKNEICNNVVQILLNNKLINENNLQSIRVEFGYLFSKTDGMLESLLKVLCSDIVFYFAIQNNSIKLININEGQYQETILYMKKNHECLTMKEIDETETQKNRRIKNNQYLKDNNITINENLIINKSESNIHLKNIDEICKRAIACLITVQIACDINNGKYKESLDFFLPIYKKYNVEECLNVKEKRIIEGTYTQQDVIDMDWAYEAYWALCWYLGFTDNIKDGSLLCDCNKAIEYVTSCNSFDEFKNRCKLRNIEELLDMYDLYHRYTWAINNKKIDDNTNIGNLNPSNVFERHRALEWLINDIEDWYNL